VEKTIRRTNFSDMDRWRRARRSPVPFPERLLPALLLQLLHTIRSERMLMEQLEYKRAVPVFCRALGE
jgi:transposase